MPNSPLTDAEIQQCKNVLGYPNVIIQANPIIGTSRVFEDVLQQYADDYGIGYIRTTILPNLTQLDLDIQAARGRYKAITAGEVKLNPQEHRALIKLREHWIKRLEETTGIKRYRGGRSGMGGSSGEVF